MGVQGLHCLHFVLQFGGTRELLDLNLGTFDFSLVSVSLSIASARIAF